MAMDYCTVRNTVPLTYCRIATIEPIEDTGKWRVTLYADGLVWDIRYGRSHRGALQIANNHSRRLVNGKV